MVFFVNRYVECNGSWLTKNVWAMSEMSFLSLVHVSREMYYIRNRI